jgi:WD40 repeat protein
MKKHITVITISVLLLVFLSGCWFKPAQTLDVPDTDIIYQAIDRRELGEEYINAIGFVNADGTNNTVIQTKIRALQPTISEDGKLIFFREPDQWPFEISPNVGTIDIWNVENGKITHCSKKLWSSTFAYPLKGTNNLLIPLSDTTVYVVDSRNCEIVREIPKVQNDTDQNIDFRSPSPSWQGTHFVYTRNSWIRILDIKTGEVRLTGEPGYNPTFSPDGKQIAFINDDDSIFIRELEASTSKKIVEQPKSYTGPQISPIPLWSPDGDWLLYHQCEREKGDCKQREHYSIYKVNVHTLEIVKIVDGGLYPVWRKMLVELPETSQ